MYVFNDIIDRKIDKLYFKHKVRPVASGYISVPQAFAIGSALLVVGMIGSFMLNLQFFLIAMTLFMLTLFYSLYFKHVVIADVLFIATNFVLRALAGVVLLGVWLSPWFFLGVFFFASLLVCAKRYVDVVKLPEAKQKYKPVLAEYDADFLKSLVTAFYALLLLIYGMYIFATGQFMLITIFPLFVYLLSRYVHLAFKADSRVRSPENFIFTHRDWPLTIVAILFIVMVFIALYWGDIFVLA